MPSGRRAADAWQHRFLVYVSPLLVAGLIAAVSAYYFRDRDTLEAGIASASAAAAAANERAANVETNVGFVVRDLAVLTALAEAERGWNRTQINSITDMLRDLQRRSRTGDLTFMAPGDERTPP